MTTPARETKRETLNSIDAARAEIDGHGKFLVAGRVIRFITNSGKQVSWSCRTTKEAKRTLAIFRASVGIVGSAQ